MMVFQEDRNSRRHIGNASGVEGAKFAMTDLAQKWANSKKGRKAVVIGITASFLYSDGKLASIAYAEPVPVPDQEPDAQPRRKKGAKA